MNKIYKFVIDIQQTTKQRYFVEYVMNARETEIHDSWNGTVRVVTKFFLEKL